MIVINKFCILLIWVCIHNAAVRSVPATSQDNGKWKLVSSSSVSGASDIDQQIDGNNIKEGGNNDESINSASGGNIDETVKVSNVQSNGYVSKGGDSSNDDLVVDKASDYVMKKTPIMEYQSSGNKQNQRQKKMRYHNQAAIIHNGYKPYKFTTAKQHYKKVSPQMSYMKNLNNGGYHVRHQPTMMSGYNSNDDSYISSPYKHKQHEQLYHGGGYHVPKYSAKHVVGYEEDYNRPTYYEPQAEQYYYGPQADYQQPTERKYEHLYRGPPPHQEYYSPEVKHSSYRRTSPYSHPQSRPIYGPPKYHEPSTYREYQPQYQAPVYDRHAEQHSGYHYQDMPHHPYYDSNSEEHYKAPEDSYYAGPPSDMKHGDKYKSEPSQTMYAVRSHFN